MNSAQLSPLTAKDNEARREPQRKEMTACDRASIHPSIGAASAVTGLLSHSFTARCSASESFSCWYERDEATRETHSALLYTTLPRSQLRRSHDRSRLSSERYTNARTHRSSYTTLYILPIHSVIFFSIAMSTTER